MATLIRPSALVGILDRLRSGFYFLVDKATDSESQKLPVENLLPGRVDLQQIGIWNMSQSLTTTVNIVDATNVIAYAVASIFDDSGNIHSANSLYDTYLNSQLTQIANLNFPLTATSDSLSHTHNIPARDAAALAGFQGRTISVGALLNPTTGIMTLRHNMPGSYANVGTAFTINGQLNSFSDTTTITNRGFILILRTITA